MSEQMRYMRREVARLQEENQALKEEASSLRHYISSLDTLLQAVDDMDTDQQAEIMAMLSRILANAIIVISAEAGSLLVLDDDTGELVFVLSHGEVPQERLAGVRIPPGKGIAGWVAEHRKPTIVNNARMDDRFYAGIDTRFQYQTESILAVPIIGDGRVLGVLEVVNKEDGGPFHETDQIILALLGRFAGEALNNVMLRQDTSGAQQAEFPPPAPPPQGPML